MSERPFVSPGSEWHRWDPHLHAPGTLRGDQFGGDWDDYLRRLENASPPVQALGITDYFCIQTYREVRKRKLNGSLPQVELIFPNVEARLDIKTAKQHGINIHLLFSNDDPNHEQEIERILGLLRFEYQHRQYQCTVDDLVRLGQAFDSRQTDRHGALQAGANQFKVSLRDLRDLFRNEAWLRRNCLVAVAGGQTDGTAGLQDDDSFAASRREIEAFADIIFSATPSQRDFWLGKKTGFDRSYIETTYGGLKPCLHGSDAHRSDMVAEPHLQRYCWIKGDLTFEALRQAVIEPEKRVWLGQEPPPHSTPSLCVREVRTLKTPWLAANALALNPGLVAVIGARGSGKTALVDIIAAGSSAIRGALDDSSFLKRAASPVDHLGVGSVTLTWGDGSDTTAPLHPSRLSPVEPGDEQVCYLSQQFVDRLCSAAGLATELRREMERVIFEATDAIERLEAGSFGEMAELYLSPIRLQRSELVDAIRETAKAIVHEEGLRDRLPILRKDLEALRIQIASDRKRLASILPKGKEERAKRLVAVENACTRAEARIERLTKQRKLLDDLAREVGRIRSHTEPARIADLRRRFTGLELTSAEWESFALGFSGDVDKLIERNRGRLEKSIANATSGDPAAPFDARTMELDQWPLRELRAARDVVKLEVGIDAEQERQYSNLQRALGQQETSAERLQTEIVNSEGAEERRRQLIEARRAIYVDVFDTLVREEEVLRQLYAPLRQQLSAAEGALSKLEFVVRRRVNVVSWATVGESLLDLRSAGQFRGHGALQEHAQTRLVGPWTTGTAKQVAVAMDSFRTEFQADLLGARPTSVGPDAKAEWIQSIADWLYSASHIEIEYGIEYDSVAIEQLSPGTRGIVLLLLYLVVDQRDRRPLIVDQPEENLDPKSVFEELVPHFREACKRRQVIIVTHNANLVVNTDADQVIVATSERTSGDGLPTISYEAGSLEHPLIRRRVCDILEGGQRAFLERERRYRFRWRHFAVDANSTS